MAKNLISSIRNRPRTSTLDPKKFIKMINESYEAERSGTQFKTKKSFSPSTVGYGYGTCARYWTIAFGGAEFTDTFNATGIASMENGTMAHERIQKRIESLGIVKDHEREILFDDPPIRGFSDTVINFNDKDIIIEIKTIKSANYIQRENEGQPTNSHLLQLLLYMSIENIDEGIVLYENKDTHELLAIPVEMNTRNREYIEYVLQWMRDVHSAWKDNEQVKRGYTKSTWACKSCPVSELCNSMEPTGIKIENLKVGVE
jgi:CRISPR/Cas system-associated exonuclease Cas4 (RecB family)